MNIIDDGDHVRHICKWLPSNIRMVEVGVFAGSAAQSFILSGKVKEYIGVDSWIPYDPNDGSSNENLAEIEKIFDNIVSEFQPRCKKIKMKSVDAAKLFEDGSLDFVYIDADHRYEFVRADIDAWLPKISKGGIIGGHDYCQGWSGVIKAVQEVFGKPDKVFADESWLVFVR